MSERSRGGSPILRHELRERPIEVAHGDPEIIEAVDRHIERFLGPVANVFHEIVSTDVHVDVHAVAPSAARPFWTLVTSGMSERPMTVPPGAEDFAFAELMITLPATWRLSMEDFQDERWYWPVRWLKTLACLPHEYATWLGFGHTVPNGDPPGPYGPGTDFCCMFVAPPVSLPEGFHTAHTPSGRAVSFYALYPLYREEMELKLEAGTDELLARFEAAAILDDVRPGRKNVAERKKLFGLF